MRLFPPELEIGPEEGFTREKDLFERQPFGEKLTRITQALEDPLVLLLDGQWGTGKTTFIRMWLGELSKIKVPTIYFDAFANDYHEDAFLTIAGEIIARSEELKPRSAKSIKAFKASAIAVAKALGRASLAIGIRTASAGLLSGDEVTEGIKISADAAKSVGDAAAKAVDELVKDRLESHKADRQAFDRFKTALTELAGSLSRPNVKAGVGAITDAVAPPSVRLVFVIDELDRCRPSFALDLLEKIKHFFTVPGIIFILVSSLQQLESATRFAYGEIDARRYLEKFYHLRLLFPADSADLPNQTTTSRYLQNLFPGQEGNKYTVIIDQYCRINPLSLRTLERIVAYTRLVSISMEKDSIFLPQIISGLCIMKVVEPRLYAAARDKKVTFGQVNDFLRFAEWRDENEPDKRHRLSERSEELWKFALGALNDKEKSRALQQGMWQYPTHDPREIVPHFCELIDGLFFPDNR